MFNESEKLLHIFDLGIELSLYKDVDLLMERILTLARQFTNAEAGSIYIREDNWLKFSYTQNDVQQKALPPGKKLVYSTFSIPINHESIAGHSAASDVMLNIPDVYNLPHEAPYTFNKEYDELSRYRTRSILTFPLKTGRGGVIGVLQLLNAKNSKGDVIPFDPTDEPFVKHFATSVAIALERAQITRQMILRVNKMAELRDPKETGAHVNRVASYSMEIYEAWATSRGVPHDEIQKNRDVLRMGAMLHDVGKVAIADAILKKPAKLDAAEYETMKQHTLFGARLFADVYSEFDEAAASIALNRHERWDGKGYPGHVNVQTGLPLPGYEDDKGKPLGKKGEEIPPFGRIVAIADVYDALSSKRAYKEPWDETAVLENLRSEAGKQFDPDMMDAFFSCIDTIHTITKRYTEP